MTEKNFAVNLNAKLNISQVKKAVETMQTSLNQLKLPEEVGSKLAGTLSRLTSELESFQAKSAKGVGSLKDFNQLERSGEKILQLYQQLRNQIQDTGRLSNTQLEKMFPASAAKNIKAARDAYRAYESEIERSNTAIKKQKGLIEQQEKAVSDLNDEIARVNGMKIVGSTKELNKLGEEVTEAKNELESLQAQAAQTSQKIKEMEETLKAPKKSSKYRELKEELAGLEGRITEANNKYTNLQAQFSNTTTIKKQTEALNNLRSNLTAATGKLTSLRQELVNMQGADGAQALQKLVETLNKIPGIKLDATTATLKQVQDAISGLTTGELNKLRQDFDKMGVSVNGANMTFADMKKLLDQLGSKARKMDAQLGDVNSLKQRITYFFGLTNSVNLLKRALNSAMTTVQELDATMTEAAVVTDFSVSDMWAKLPEYTKQASRLGATVNDLYGATTLYYQQGLKTNEAMALGTETIKMARIAGMDAADATDKMTAALRGFNMELNEASAMRVNDVYSQLAAITAADTEQIATAMTKTASIAHSANMQFETTAALLAQIIETTQEAPETAGTAMKTIIARFSEVKDLKNKGQSLGEDIEGEVIDVNKIQTALRTVGISMDEFFAGTEGLDDVLLRLAEKWNTLDFETQRYIATTAAGSRQQSRFIAMMSDYERTMELVGEANNSAGASQKQYEKTLDSMKAKLNKLKNAWDQFTMGLADNEIIKLGIDAITWILEKINALTDAISGNNGLLKSVLNLGVALGGLKLGGKALTKGLNVIFGLDADDFKLDGSEVQEDLVTGGDTAKKALIDGANTARKIMIDAATTAANIEKGGAAAEVSTELSGAAAEAATELGGAVEEAVIETEGVAAETAAELASGEAEGAIEQAAATAEAEIETAGGVEETATETSGGAAETATETAGGAVETATEVEGAKIEEAIEIGSSATGGSGFKELFSGGATKIKGFLSKNGKMLGSIGGIIAAAAIIGTVTSAIEKKGEKIFTTGEHLSSLEAVESDLIDSTKELSTELGNLGSKHTNFNKMVQSLEKMTKGSAEWASTVHDVRTEMQNILSAYPDLINYTETLNGVTVLTEDGWAQYEKLLTSTYYERMQSLYGSKMGQTYLGGISAAENLSTPTSSITQEEEAKLLTHQKNGAMIGGIALATAGWLTGTVIGAKIGGAIGTAIAPGIGTAIGAALGVAIGAGIGWLTGGGATQEKGVAPELINQVALAASQATMENQKGEEVGFSAVEATDEQIEAFVNELELVEEEAIQLKSYIKANREEFDKHTVAVMENQQALYNYGLTMGASKAQERGYTGETASIYEQIYGNVTQDAYDIIYETELARAKTENLSSGNIIAEIVKATGFTWNSATQQYEKDGQALSKDEFSEEEQRIALANYRTMQKITGRADKVFKLMTSTSLDYAAVQSALASGQTTSIGALTYDQINQHRDNIVNDTINALAPWSSTDRQERINKALKLESEGYETGLYASTRFNYADGTQFVTTHETDAVDQKFAQTWLNNQAGAYDAWLKNKQAEYAQNSGKVVRSASEAKNKEIYFGFSSDVTRPGDEWKDGVESLENYWDAIAEYTNYSSEMVQAYIKDGKDGVLAQYGEEILNTLLPKVQKYAEAMPFLTSVSMDAAIQFGDMINGLKNVYDLGDYEKNNKLEGVINTIMEGVGSDNWTMVATTLASLNFENLTQLKWFEGWLSELPGVSESATSAAQEFVEYLEKTGLAFVEIRLEDLVKQLTDTQKIIKKIGDIDIGETAIFSQEELTAMLSSGANRDDFVSTVDGYVYLGDSMENLRATLQQSNAMLLQLHNDALRTKIETGSFIKDSTVLSELSWGTTGTWTVEQIDTVLDNMVNEALANYNDLEGTSYGIYGISEDVWETMTKGTPLSGFGYDFFKDWRGTDGITWDEAGVQELIRSWLAETGDSFMNLALYESQYDSGLRDIEEQELSLMSGQQMLEAQKTGTYSGESVDRVMDYQLSQDAGADVTAERWTNQLKEQGGKNRLDTVQKLAKALVIDFKAAEKAQDKLNNAVLENGEAFKTAKKGSQEYNKALDLITEAAKGVFGDKITTEFVESNKWLFLQLAEGGEIGQKAYEELGKRAAANMLGMAYESQEFAKVLTATMSGIPTNLEIGATFDATQAINNLMALGYTAADAAAILEEMGYTVTYTTETHYIGNTTGTDYGVLPPKGGIGLESVTATEVVVASGVKNDASGTGFNPNTGGGGSSTPWENPYDEQYNTVQLINAELRKREQLERKYQKLIKKTNTNAADLIAAREESLASLESERQTREGLKQFRINAMDSIMGENSQYTQYAWYDKETGTIQMDWAAIDAYSGSTDNQEFLDGLTAYVDKLEEGLDLIREEEDAIDDIADNVESIYEEGRDEYFDLEERIKEALVGELQREIDELTAINESINETNANLIDAMQTAIDKQRQERDNQKTEDEIADKQRRLLYLQQDTSGANDLEILELQKEISEMQEDYTDTLIDQKISELQKQNDEAAKQRQQQIDIAQAQLDHYIISGGVWKDVYELMQSGIDPATGMIIDGSRLMGLLKENEEYLSKSTLGKMQWTEDLKDVAALAQQWLQTGNSIEGLVEKGELKTGDTVSFKTKDGKDLKGTVTEDGHVKVNDKIYTGVYRDWEGNFTTKENESDGQVVQDGPPDLEDPQVPTLTEVDKRGVSAAIWNGGYGWGSGQNRVDRLRECFGDNDIQKNYVDKHIGKNDKVDSQYSYANMRMKFRGYKTGGLADFTGPAWLDGTKAKPEYVLNAEQTQAFLYLVDILGSLGHGKSERVENGGATTIDVDINIETVKEEADIDMLAEKVSNAIVTSAQYRNNNFVKR